MRSYCEGLCQRDKTTTDIAVALDLVETVETNIEHFLKGRPLTVLNIRTVDEDLPKFFAAIEADVDINEALSEFHKKRNSSTRKNPMFWMRLRLSLMMDKLELMYLAMRKKR